LIRIKNREIGMSETYFGRYAALQKRNAAAAILDFSDKVWDSLKRMREADSCKGTNIDLADDNGNNVGALGSWKQCKQCLLINLTLLPCVETMILL